MFSGNISVKCNKKMYTETNYATDNQPGTNAWILSLAAATYKFWPSKWKE